MTQRQKGASECYIRVVDSTTKSRVRGKRSMYTGRDEEGAVNEFCSVSIAKWLNQLENNDKK